MTKRILQNADTQWGGFGVARLLMRATSHNSLFNGPEFIFPVFIFLVSLIFNSLQDRHVF